MIMSLITLENAKQYLRVDSADEDSLIETLIQSAGRLCADVARLSEQKWKVINGEADPEDIYTEDEVKAVQETMRVAILYAIGYLYEHREEADHHDLVLTLRCLLFVLREGVL